MEKVYLGIDVGGTNTKFCLTDKDLNVLTCGKCPTDKSVDIVIFLSRLIEKIREKYNNIAFVSLGLPGIVDIERGVVHTAPSIIKGTRNLREELQESVGLPVFIENDVTLWALAEGKQGSCKGMKDYILITLGTGIGSCMVLDGKPYKGFDLGAGEIGYMVFLEDLSKNAKTHDEFGSFEEKASAHAIVKGFNGISKQKLTFNEIFDAFKDTSNEKAQKFLYKKMDYLSVGLANVITILHPQAVVLAGGIMSEWDYLYPLIKERIDKLVSTKTQILNSSTGEYGGALGAVINGINRRQ